MVSRGGGVEETTDAEPRSEEYDGGEFLHVVRVAASVVIAVVTGVATYLAGVGGQTALPSRYVAPVALFVALGLFVAFYVDLAADRE